MRRTYERAVSRGEPLSIFPDEIFRTNNDEDNRAAVRAIDPAALNLAGLSFRADAKIADKITSGLQRHR